VSRDVILCYIKLRNLLVLAWVCLWWIPHRWAILVDRSCRSCTDGLVHRM